ncbi:MAG: heme biosynthesis protein HemY, partial [Burkholderiaceae bacterium]|nr:heme biosynthesis protein HemY [Burkholderiaceae bacterium]
MRGIIWLVLLFVVAVVAATTLGRNDGLVSIYFGHWRTDLSLNLFVLLVLAACAVMMAAARSINSLVSLPQRAREWRQLRRERAAHAALREALAEYFAARFSRAHRAAQRALVLRNETEVLRGDGEFRVLGLLLAAASLHRMQDRTRRDDMMRQLRRKSREGWSTRPVDEGARLLAAEWAIDDRDAPRAIELLGELPAGVARRTQALRLRLLAQRLSLQPLQALQTARLLA